VNLTNNRPRLSDILYGSGADRKALADAWDRTDAADDLKPLPPGEYECDVSDGALFSAKSGTPGYKLTLTVREGVHAGRKLWHDVWLTPTALPLAKRDLGKLGVTSLEQLERPLPQGIVVKAKVVLRKSDDGDEFNRVSRFEVVRVEAPERDPFAPSDHTEAPSPPSRPERNGREEADALAQPSSSREDFYS